MAVNKNNVKIHVEHLEKTFGKIEVLKDISNDIYEGEVVVVIGPSGSENPPFCVVSTVLSSLPAEP